MNNDVCYNSGRDHIYIFILADDITGIGGVDDIAIIPLIYILKF